MIRTLSHRWHLILYHLLHNSTVGMGFVLILLGFLLQEDKGIFVMYCLTLGTLLSIDAYRMSVSIQPVDASLMLFGLLLVLLADDPLTDGILFRLFLIPVSCALIVAGWIHSSMISSATESARQSIEKSDSETTTKGTGQ